MKKTYKYVVAIAVVSTVLVGFILVVPKGDFEWGIDIGESFNYEILTWGDYGNQYVAGVPSSTFINLNNTIIEAVIVTLPAVNWITNANSFLSSVVQVIKVNCRFVNGTELASQDNEILSEMISVCLLPIGDWSVLDSFYNDEIAPWEPSQEYYASRLLESQFDFEWTSYGDFDSREEWTGHLMLENGVPYEIIWHYNHSADIYVKLNLEDT